MKLEIKAMSNEDQTRLDAAQARRERKWARNKAINEDYHRRTDPMYLNKMQIREIRESLED